ncbi:GGDEF domain-containing protein [Desulfogranum japonicum]|uniref:GGDEF domain-containing protein n=1 Tax=Desulfogranum japonicum TaxID=231447 RepID=UPI0004178587|nr:GGDEF domain-containing protein [Desulfogranum japonicum]
MNATIFEREQHGDLAHLVSTLQSEIDRYKRQAKNLTRMNSLHQRMASILDLPSMIEKYSIWLMEYVQHDLFGFNNPCLQRLHMYCSHHGPRRRQSISLAELLLRRLDQYPMSEQLDNLYACKWAIQREQTCEGLVFVRMDTPFSREELQFIEDTLPVLSDTLRRALEFEKIFTQNREDPLTGLPNRVVFEERMPIAMEQARRHGHPLSLAALDLDHFKSVNDAMGHLIGDKVLKNVSRAMNNEIRQTDLLARMGGDEFLLVMPDTTIKEAAVLAQRLCNAVKSLNIHAAQKTLGVSIGLAEWDLPLSQDQWIELADNRLYQAKANGKSQVLYH